MIHSIVHTLLASSIICAGQSAPRIVKVLFTKTTAMHGTRQPIH